MTELFLVLLRILFPLDPVARLREITREYLNWLVTCLEDPQKLNDFLTNPEDQATYVSALRSALRSGGWVIIGGFAKGGHTRCSGLEIVQHDAASLKQLLGEDFVLEDVRSEAHRTPSGSEQLFAYHVFKKRS